MVEVDDHELLVAENPKFTLPIPNVDHHKLDAKPYAKTNPLHP